MTYEKAIKLLDPKISQGEIAKLEYYLGFNKDQVVEIIDEACLTACRAMERLIEIENGNYNRE